MIFELEKKQVNEFRNLIKSAYEAIGMYENYKQMGQNLIPVDHVINIYQSYIQLMEIVLDETNDSFHEKYKKKITKDDIKEYMDKFK